MEIRTEKWPAECTVKIFDRYRIKAGITLEIKPGTTAVLVGADSMENKIRLWINPAIGWQGTYQELCNEWESVSRDTPLTL